MADEMARCVGCNDRFHFETLDSEGNCPNCHQPKRRQWIVQWRGYSIQFVANHCGKVWSVCPDDEATRFDCAGEARIAMAGWQMNPAEFEVVEVAL
jgi:predicted RNA-binding Zn-ribbon protein involved in translation (DUF1610 family)